MNTNLALYTVAAQPTRYELAIAVLWEDYYKYKSK